MTWPNWHAPASLWDARPGLHVKEPRVVSQVMQHHRRGQRLVIQAGAHLGVWPAALSAYFTQVFAFEPVWENWCCAVQSIQATNVSVFWGALGATQSPVQISCPAKRYTGSARILREDDTIDGRPVACYTIDQCCQGFMHMVDAIFLDVEGYERQVLTGAMATLRASHPMLVLEEHGLGLRYGDAENAIQQCVASLGYCKVARYGRDVVYV